MMDLIGAGDTFASRSKWATERRDEIDELIEKLEKEEERRGANTEKYRAITKSVRGKIDYYLHVCKSWLEFGWEAETILYLREVYLQVHDIAVLANRKNLITEAICDPGRPEATWSFLSEAGYKDSQLAAMAGSSTLFGNKVSLAQFLNGTLYESVKDAKERLQRISFLLGSAVQPTDPETVKKLYPNGFDLDAELALVRHESTRASCWQISQIYQHHQRHREALQWKELAALKGQTEAVFSLAEDALTAKEFTKAARLFDKHFTLSAQAYSLGISSQAWKMAGEDQLARQRMFYASVIPQHYGSPMIGFYKRFVDDERGHWISDLARLDGIIGQSSRYEELRVLLNMMNCWKMVDPIESANFGRRALLKLSTHNSVSGYSYLLLYAKESRVHDVMGAVEEGDFDAVKSIFDQINIATITLGCWRVPNAVSIRYCGMQKWRCGWHQIKTSIWIPLLKPITRAENLTKRSK